MRFLFWEKVRERAALGAVWGARVGGLSDVGSNPWEGTGYATSGSRQSVGWSADSTLVQGKATRPLNTNKVTSSACRAKVKIRPPLTFHLYLRAARLSWRQETHLPLASSGGTPASGVSAGPWSSGDLRRGDESLRAASWSGEP